MRAITLREGEAVLAERGAERAVRPGDRMGSGVVKAIGADRLILEVPMAGSGPTEAGQTTVVITFDGTGRARVRRYALPGRIDVPPEVR